MRLHVFLLLAALTASVSLGAQAPAKSYSAPRTPWGHPDLQGTYSNDDETGTPMERPAQFAGKRAGRSDPRGVREAGQGSQRSLRQGRRGHRVRRRPASAGASHLRHLRAQEQAGVAGGGPARRPHPAAAPTRRASARALAGGISTNANPNGPFNSWLDMGLYDRCITRGIPASMMPAGYGSYYEIVQSPDSVAIRYEMIHETRVVPFDRRPRVSPVDQAVPGGRAGVVGRRHAGGRDAEFSGRDRAAARQRPR